MLYDELSWCIYNLNKKGLINKNKLFDFVENVRKYDTWLWKEKYNDFTPKKLNDLFFILGYERFENEIINNLNCNLYNTKNFIDENKLLLELQQERIDKYIEKKNKEIIEYDIAGNKAGVVFAEQFQSELGNKLSELNPQYDLIIMIGDKTISYRTVKDNVNCGEIAKLFSGGGHPKASGSQISDKVKLEYIKSLFKL
ncbi:DHHA1 domain-containing protein [Clostridium sp. ZBS18]|uniref:DHHA1 domain-containing protein n=1 Tax=Clostridium sp. ZBS18 TaxID=2949967 RepID=UPI0020794E78|nr:DHHA1 domain-containing protein [Clostridium sp. ZBS18]